MKNKMQFLLVAIREMEQDALQVECKQEKCYPVSISKNGYRIRSDTMVENS
jgi:hypothetical protein